MKIVVFCLIYLVVVFLDSTSAQSPSDVALQFDVTLTKNPPSIILKWDLVRISGYDFTNAVFTVYRTNPTNLGSWGAVVKNIPIVNTTNTYSYSDTNVSVITTIFLSSMICVLIHNLSHADVGRCCVRIQSRLSNVLARYRRPNSSWY